MVTSLDEDGKSLFPPTKCINVYCKEEKRELKRQIESLTQENDDCKYRTQYNTAVQFNEKSNCRDVAKKKLPGLSTS